MELNDFTTRWKWLKSQLYKIPFCDEYLVDKKGNIYNKEQKLLKQSLSHGYKVVNLNAKKMRVHRIVAMTFIPNPKNKSCVNHINGIKTDNRVENLEWCSYAENNLHAYRILGKKPVINKPFLGKFGKEHNKSKVIVQIKNNKIINCFYGANEAERKTKINCRHINECCNNKRKTAGGFSWKFKKDI